MLGFMYGQTEYQILENAIHLEDYVSFGVSNGFSFLTITDSNLQGHFKFYNLCKANNIKPVIGLSVKINSNLNRENIILLYAKNKIGYQNLLEISSKQALDGVVSDEFIINHCDGLFLVTSAVESDLDYLIYCQEYSNALAELKRLQGLTKEFYLGVMPSSFLYETIYQDLFKLQTKYNLVMLPVSKTSYLTNEDELVYHSLLKIGETNKVLSIDDLHLKTKEELEAEFKEINYVFKNLDSVINSIEDDLISFDHPLPTFQNKLGISSGEYLSKLCKKGLDKRLLCTNYNKDEYLKRLEYELSVINKMNYNDYFLIVWDFVKFAKNNKILVGPGRGSAPGSLVAYCLGITEIDPIKY
jgi:DNA polymerase-3 subunit alpha